MKKFLLTLFILILFSMPLLAEDQSTEVNSFSSDRIGSCIAIRYSDAKTNKILYDFITAAEISSIKLLVNKAGKLYIRIKSENEANDYIFVESNRKNVLLALQTLINDTYANHKNNAKDKLDLFIDR